MCLEGKKNCGGAEGNLQDSVPDSFRAPLLTGAKSVWQRVAEVAEPNPGLGTPNTLY